MRSRSCLVVIFLLGGCAASVTPTHLVATTAPSTKPVPTTDPAVVSIGQGPPPFLLHLPGIGGERRVDHNLIRGIAKGGFAGEETIDDWTEGRRGIPALRDEAEHAREAQRIADRLTAIRRADPQRSITVIGHSGGTGLAVEALRRLPPDVKIDRLILLASALSPGYDLTPALRHVGTADNFVSPFDVLILGAGTMLFGTFDGIHSPAAGLLGFITPPTADQTEYAKLHEHVYDNAWQAFGNTGQHIGPLSEAFAEFVLAPLVLGRQPMIPLHTISQSDFYPTPKEASHEH